MAEQSFAAGLNKHGYKVNGTNAFVAEGGYGMVFRVQRNDKRYACKVISNMLFHMKTDRGPLNTLKLRTRFANEVDIMKRVGGHPNIVRFVESFSDQVTTVRGSANQQSNQVQPPSADDVPVSDDGDDYLVFKNFFLVMEYANSKTLSYYVKNRLCLTEHSVKNIFRQLVDAVKFLHDQHIAHRDLKLSNLLLQTCGGQQSTADGDRSSAVVSGRRARNTATTTTATATATTTDSFNYSVKLCDFGLSSIVTESEDGGYFVKPVGTSFYMSPEILRSYYFCNRKQVSHIVPYCAFKGDVWALGVCMFYCLHGYYPLNGLCKGTKAERMAELEKIFSVADLEHTEPGEQLDQIYAKRFRAALRNYHYKLSFNCRELLSKMIEVEPNKRTEIADVANHPYLR